MVMAAHATMVQYTEGYISPKVFVTSCHSMATMIAEQLLALEALVKNAPAKAHAESLRTQLTGKKLSQQEVTEITNLVTSSPFDESQKSSLLVCLSTCLLNTHDISGNSTARQRVVDFMPYLTASELANLKDKVLTQRINRDIRIKSRHDVMHILWGRKVHEVRHARSCKP